MSEDADERQREERGDEQEKGRVKVTDRRMFTPEGELREEYRDLEGKAEESGDDGAESAAAGGDAREPAADRTPPGGAGARPVDRGAGGPAGGREVPGGAGARPVPGGAGAREVPGGAGARPVGGGEESTPRGAPVEIPSSGPGPQPSFLDLVGLLAEPVPIYLGDAELPDGGSAENLEAARLHIDLLDMLRQKTAGNLTSQESAVLEDVIYRLRMRYVQKRG